MDLQQTIPALIQERAQQSSEGIGQWVLDSNGDWKPITFQCFYQQVISLACDLQSHGISKGQVVGIMATGGHKWELFHHAILMLGGVVVGIDPGEISEQLEEIVNIAKIKVLVIDHQDRLEKFPNAALAAVESIIYYEIQNSNRKVNDLSYIDINNVNTGESNQALPFDTLRPSDIATIIFTSGSTGKPKGIAYRHDQIFAAIDAILDSYPELSNQPCHLVSWLPLSNLFQRIVNLCAIAGGAEVFFVEQPQKIIEFLPKINPHIFIAVPRFYEKLYQNFENKLAEQPEIVGYILKACLRFGEADSIIGKIFRKLNSIIFKSFTTLFGDNIRYMVSGSAPMPLWLIKRYNAMGLLILEAYGLSENVVPIAANRLTDYRFGCVGKALKGNQLKLTEDGELLVKGVGVFSGYLSNQQHERSLSVDGYLATGDYAEIDAEGFIRLIGRKSEIFKTSTGRKIAPAAIEALFQNNPSVEHAVVIGESRKFLIVLITVGIIDFHDEKERVAYVNTLTRNLILLTSDLPNYKQPAGGIVCFKSLSVQQLELTTNLKLKRKNIQQHYKRWIDELYAALEDPQSPLHHEPLLVNPDIMLVKF